MYIYIYIYSCSPHFEPKSLGWTDHYSMSIPGCCLFWYPKSSLGNWLHFSGVVWTHGGIRVYSTCSGVVYPKKTTSRKPLKMALHKRKVVVLPSFFRGELLRLRMCNEKTRTRSLTFQYCRPSLKRTAHRPWNSMVRTVRRWKFHLGWPIFRGYVKF